MADTRAKIAVEGVSKTYRTRRPRDTFLGRLSRPGAAR